MNILKFTFFQIKRILKKKSYLLLLFLMPVFAFCVSHFSSAENGMVHIALIDEDESVISQSVLRDFLEMDSNIVFYESDFDDAISKLKSGGIDSVFVLKRGFEDEIKSIAHSGLYGDPCIDFYVREDETPLMLARIRTFSVIYPYITRATNADKIEIYERYLISDKMFESVSVTQKEIGDYLITPVKGFMVVFVMMSALFGMAYFHNDKEDKLLGNRSVRERGKLSYAYSLAATIPAGIIAFLVMLILGYRIYVIAAVLFMLGSILLGRLLGVLLNNSRALLTIMPAFVMLFLVLCPIFLNLRQLRLLQFFIPGYHYLIWDNSLYEMISFLALLIVLLLLNCLVDRVYEKKDLF